MQRDAPWTLSGVLKKLARPRADATVEADLTVAPTRDRNGSDESSEQDASDLIAHKKQPDHEEFEIFEAPEPRESVAAIPSRDSPEQGRPVLLLNPDFDSAFVSERSDPAAIGPDVRPVSVIPGYSQIGAGRSEQLGRRAAIIVSSSRSRSILERLEPFGNDRSRGRSPRGRIEGVTLG